MDRQVQQPQVSPIASHQKQEDKRDSLGQEKKSITLIPVEVDKDIQQYESQFLQIDAQMMHKLEKIDQSKKIPLERSTKSNQITLPPIKSQQDQKQQQALIKRQFVHKLKQWQRQREELKIRKYQIEQRKLKQKQSQKERKQRQMEEERQFLKLQKKKQIQQKIQEIEQRRQQREQSLKNAILKRSYNRLPSYSQQEQRYKEDDREEIEINIKLLKSKRKLSKIDPEELKIHQKAYIQRIKERLNMVPKRQEKAKSDFNLYLKRNEEKKEEEMKKIQKMKKYQENINKIPIKISENKKQQKLIQIDKIKNPQKYRLLSNKLLNDKQIFQQFKNFEININRKEIGMNYLKQLKQMHEHLQKTKVRSKRSNSQIINNNYEQKLPSINRKYERVPISQPQKTKSVQLQHSQSYKNTLDKNRAKDSRYMKALRQKLAGVIDM